jgi:hypothetical protein
MERIKGYRLLVNLGAAATRRRLKNAGCGVRKVQTAGKGQAQIIHTATGDHCRALYALFQDVLVMPPDEDAAEPAADDAAETGELD